MLHLSSYHSNGLPTVVWSNKVNLIGEKVYKPKIHFCEHCNKPILIYGRLIPCKHVFCFTCATLCLTKSQQSIKSASSPPLLPNSNNSINDSSKIVDFHRSDESTSNTTPTTVQQESMDSPNLLTSGTGSSKGCHRCGGKALRVERNTLNSIFVCQVEACRRSYLSARDLQAHVTHRHSKNKSNQHAGTSSASMAAISSSPYISSSTLLHLNNQNERHQRQSSSSSANNHHNNVNSRLSNNSPNFHPNHHNNQNHQNQHHHNRENGSQRHHRPPPHHQRDRDRDRNRFRDRDNHHRDRERERENKEYHRQSIQRAAQWAEASAQLMEKGLTR